MQPLRKLLFVALLALSISLAFPSSQVAFAHAEDDVAINEFLCDLLVNGAVVVDCS